MYQFNLSGTRYKLELEFGTYMAGAGKYVALVEVGNKELFADVTINIPGVPLHEGEVIIKDEAPDLLFFLHKNNIIGPVLRYAEAGMSRYPICELLKTG